MLCKNCGLDIVGPSLGGNYFHVNSDRMECRITYAEPCMGYVDRKLDAKTILAEMEARQPHVAAKVKRFNPDLVEGNFEGEL